jgi:hypothetical protein
VLLVIVWVMVGENTVLVLCSVAVLESVVVDV